MDGKWPGLDRRILLVGDLNGFLERLYLAITLSGIFFIALTGSFVVDRGSIVVIRNYGARCGR